MTVEQLKHQQFHDVGNDAEVVNNDYINFYYFVNLKLAI